MWKTYARSHRFGLGRVGAGGIPLGGGGRRTENRVHIYVTCHVKFLLYVIHHMQGLDCKASEPGPES